MDELKPYFLLQIKGIDANRYATKKTIAQGMLDIALLTSNASQLKYILQAGDKHEFYHFMLVLVTVSICLQIAQGILAVFLGSIDINKEQYHRKANLCQNAALSMNMISVIINIMINTMEIKSLNGFNAAALLRKDL